MEYPQSHWLHWSSVNLLAPLKLSALLLALTNSRISDRAGQSATVLRGDLKRIVFGTGSRNGTAALAGSRLENFSDDHNMTLMCILVTLVTVGRQLPFAKWVGRDKSLADQNGSENARRAGGQPGFTLHWDQVD
jgi:hypothetical protein